MEFEASTSIYWWHENVPESETNEFKQEHVKLETATGREIHSHSHPQTTDPTRMQCMVAVGWFIHGSHTSPVWLLATSCHKMEEEIVSSVVASYSCGSERVADRLWLPCLPGRSTKPSPCWAPHPFPFGTAWPLVRMSAVVAEWFRNWRGQ